MESPLEPRINTLPTPCCLHAVGERGVRDRTCFRISSSLWKMSQSMNAKLCLVSRTTTTRTVQSYIDTNYYIDFTLLRS
jgi:hypothetical protein